MLMLISLIIVIVLIGISRLTIRENYYNPEMEQKLVDNRILNNVNSRKIPKNIVQSLNCRKITKKLYENIEKIKKLNPDYNYEFYTEKESIDFINKHFGEDYTKAYIKLYYGAFRADFFRYCYLYVKGGFWIDVFMELNYPLDELLDKDYNFITCLDLRDKNNVNELPMLYKICLKNFTRTDVSSVYNAFLGFEPKNKIMKEVLEKSYENIMEEKESDLGITGPDLFGKIIDNTDLNEYTYKFLNFKPKNMLSKIIRGEDLKLDNGVFDGNKRIITNKYPGHEKDKNMINNKIKATSKTYNENFKFVNAIVDYNKDFEQRFNSSNKSVIYFLNNNSFESLYNVKLNDNENHIIFNNFEETSNVEIYQKLNEMGFLIYFNSFKIRDQDETIKIYIDELVNNKNYSLIKV